MAKKDTPQLSPLMQACLRGDSSISIAFETVRRLGKEMEANGKDTFTMGDLRRIQNKMFEG